ncbi:hypothetical protein WICPIJ_001134 [Wickerhamomyces pijperi]|uniref:Uncharacterized protein n=1 Tax=Wickerhamomyces pijperi TaxID=599730 RepID=A0A9P8QCB8_WICPI|nr:hypothetical protein WICPIJ_001134 [Wickerhamomyces pijperi]
MASSASLTITCLASHLLPWISTISMEVQPCSCRALIVRSTCSIHGEKQQIPTLSSELMTLGKFGMAVQGDGRSRKMAVAFSSTSSISNPSLHTSLWLIVTGTPRIPCSSNSLLASSNLGLWNSKVNSLPLSDTVLASECENEADPVPASMTLEPLVIPNL